MFRSARLAAAALAAVVVPLTAPPAYASTIYDTLYAGLAQAQASLSDAHMTTNVHYAEFEGVLSRDANGDYASTICYEVSSDVRVLPCTVTFRFSVPLATVCDPPGDQAVLVGSFDYRTETAGGTVANNRLTSGGVGSTYRHAHGSIVDMGEAYGLPTIFNIDIDLTEPCTNREAKYPLFTGVVTYT